MFIVQYPFHQGSQYFSQIFGFPEVIFGTSSLNAVTKTVTAHRNVK